jgi:hypothetical protein
MFEQSVMSFVHSVLGSSQGTEIDLTVGVFTPAGVWRFSMEDMVGSVTTGDKPS